MSSLAHNNDGQLALIESNIGFLDVYKGTLMSKLVNENKGVTMKVIAYLLERLNDQFNMNLKINRPQLITIAFDLMHKFKGETIEDVVLFFRMARQGELGSKLHRLDSHVIFNEWFPVYMDLKSMNREDVLKDRKENSNIDLMSKEKWTDKNKENLTKILDTFKKEKTNLKIKRDDLSDTDSFMDSLKIDVQNMDLKELNDFKEHCDHRRFTDYSDIIKREIDKRK